MAAGREAPMLNSIEAIFYILGYDHPHEPRRTPQPTAPPRRAPQEVLAGRPIGNKAPPTSDASAALSVTIDDMRALDQSSSCR